MPFPHENKAAAQQRKRSISLPRIGGLSAARRSISAAGAAASSMASTVSAAASCVLANPSNVVASVPGVSGVASVAATSVTAVTTGVSYLRRPNLPMQLPALKHSPSPELPRLSLEGSDASRPPMCLHNVGLIRLIFEEARDRHLARPSYQARQRDSMKEKFMPSVILREVCSDIRSATRTCCKAYRAMKILKDAARVKMESRDRVNTNLRNMRRKLLVAGVFAKMLRDAREENAKAELMWKQCCAGLGSWSLSSKAFASRSLGPRSWRCGGISLALRSRPRRNGVTNVERNDQADMPDVVF